MSANIKLIFADPVLLVTDGFSSQRASNTENVSLSWRHQALSASIDMCLCLEAKLNIKSIVFNSMFCIAFLEKSLNETKIFLNKSWI